jgi:hypothetical protein
MKKILLTLLLVAALASPALANQIQVGYPGSLYGPYQSGSGGEFTFNDVNPASWLDLTSYAAATKDFGPAGITSFQTFCLELEEHIEGYPHTYYAELGPNAMYGGNYPAGDPISVGTGWLYSQFAAGTLAKYNYSMVNNGFFVDRKAAAGALQNTIWWLEGALADPGAGNVFRNAVIANFGSAGNAMADGGWLYGVYAVNLWTSPTVRDQSTSVQDGLYFKVRVPDGGTTVMLLGGVLIALGAIRRKLSL